MKMTPIETEFIDNVYAAAKRGAMREILLEFKKMDLDRSSSEFTSFAGKYAARFDVTPSNNQILDCTLLEQILQAFHNYWRQCLVQRFAPEDGPEFLYNRLRLSTGLDEDHSSFSQEKLDILSDKLKVELAKLGIKSLWGRVLPHYEFMAWRREEESQTIVCLPGDEVVEVPITYLDDFVSLGWTGFATFDKIHNGGWATRERVFCVLPYYDLTSERFKVSLLAHEGRHFADYKKYPRLKAVDLEYRAKLTELSMADVTLGRLAKSFRDSAFNDPSSPHALAAFHIMRGAHKEIEEFLEDSGSLSKKSALQERALALLMENNAMLDTFGPEQVESAFVQLS